MIKKEHSNRVAGSGKVNRNGKVVAIIQARTGSTRLPGKVLLDLAGQPVLSHVVQRVRRAARVDQVVVATTARPEDRAVVRLAQREGAAVFCGSEDDVLDRTYQAARRFQADVVVRVTADCPLIDPAIVDQTIARFQAADGPWDYVATDNSFPDGLDTEVFSVEALTCAWRKARMASEREHVTPFLYKHPERFRTLRIACQEDLSQCRWTLDESEDLEFLRALLREAEQRGTALRHLKDVRALLRQKPDLQRINAHIGRNEGYTRSLESDYVIET